MAGRFDSELVPMFQWFNGRVPVCKTGDLRFKSWLGHKFFSQYLSYGGRDKGSLPCGTDI